MVVGVFQRSAGDLSGSVVTVGTDRNVGGFASDAGWRARDATGNWGHVDARMGVGSHKSCFIAWCEGDGRDAVWRFIGCSRRLVGLEVEELL